MSYLRFGSTSTRLRAHFAGIQQVYSTPDEDRINTQSSLFCNIGFALSTDSRGAFQDPTHTSFWDSNSFWYYTRPEQNQFIDCPVQFQPSRVKNFYPSEWHREHQIVYVKADLRRR